MIELFSQSFMGSLTLTFFGENFGFPVMALVRTGEAVRMGLPSLPLPTGVGFSSCLIGFSWLCLISRLSWESFKLVMR